MRYSWISKSAWKTLVMCNNWIFNDETVHCCWCLTMCIKFFALFWKKKTTTTTQFWRSWDKLLFICDKIFRYVFYIYILKPSIAINMLPFFCVTVFTSSTRLTYTTDVEVVFFLLSNHEKLRKVWRSFWFVMRLKSVIQTVTTSRAWWIKIEEIFPLTHFDRHIQTFSVCALTVKISKTFR